MRTVNPDNRDASLERRHALGLDFRDEIWDGVYHVVPSPSKDHQVLGTKLLVVLAPLAEQRQLQAVYELNIIDPAKGMQNLRVPDLVVYDPEHATRQGVEGRAELVVEILSPKDDSYKKLRFYAQMGVQEMLIIDANTRTVERYVLRGSELIVEPPDVDGVHHLSAIGLSMTTIDTDDGPRLRLTWVGGSTDI